MGKENLETDPRVFGNFEMALQFYGEGWPGQLAIHLEKKNKLQLHTLHKN